MIEYSSSIVAASTRWKDIDGQIVEKKKPAILQKPSANQIEVCLFGSGAEIIKITIIMRSNEIDEFRIRYIGQDPLSIHCCFFFSLISCLFFALVQDWQYFFFFFS